MEYKNLQRAAEIAHELPSLLEARVMLSDGAAVVVRNGNGEAPLPASVNMNVVNAVNAEINRLREEIKTL